ncbi:hypothetical protein BDD14_3399 [Edaphobacter modestus]|uniref:Uncharacterized protein n=1 Tax=Edaphobacter modestus TaxID=388466 RepID=A0A4Q7YVF8_9BACT|nr:hypothetical protein BDD14_3399 [Edaphobacter modestus]
MSSEAPLKQEHSSLPAPENKYCLLWPVHFGNNGHVLAIHTPISRFGALEQLRSRFSDLQLSESPFLRLKDR